eukprot:TRINITY_DN9940_c0_g1_i1.p1 TRINITY_DN9940_c0_g1~~TRINITY_DN9940_c0_g1_i1.p1  ORF type:complete len:193 (+),score=8.06 TRINITY_DN9940_c0_g1_i1:101-679(+)
MESEASNRTKVCATEAKGGQWLERRLVDFCRWILKSTKGRDEEMVLAFIIYSRLEQTRLFDKKTPWWKERLLGCSLLIAIKVLREAAPLPSNQRLAALLSLSVQQLNLLEREILTALDFDVQTTSAEYQKYVKMLERKPVKKPREATPDSPVTSPVKNSPEKRHGKKRLHSSIQATSPCTLPAQPLKKVRRG